MRKVYVFSFLLIIGLVLSQIVPHLLGVNFPTFKTITDALLYVSLAYIMINVGREFEINKKQWRSYSVDSLIAMEPPLSVDSGGIILPVCRGASRDADMEKRGRMERNVPVESFRGAHFGGYPFHDACSCRIAPHVGL